MSPEYVVSVTGKLKDGTPFYGTGFFVDSQGRVATCLHVVKNADLIVVQLPYAKPGHYQVLEASESSDLALLESLVPLGARTPVAGLSRSRLTDAAIGSRATAWGYSAQKNYNAPQRFECTVSGFEGGLGRIGLNGDINPGDSGGPVLDEGGNVIGIAQGKDPARNGQAMAIPVSLLVDLLKAARIDPFADAADRSQPTRQFPEVTEHFLGREEDLKRTLDQVRLHRVVTLTGIGGIGKSELAKAVARAAEGQEWTTGGVFYVDLQATTDTNLVKSTLASALALKPDKPIPDQLAGNRLYVLDDLYQALVGDRKGLPDFVRALHDSAAPSHFLLTSRQPIGLPGVENPWPLGRLLPPHDVDLFRKVADGFGYKWREDDTKNLSTLLEQLDGYPLAIMIAANWLSDLNLEIILRRWANRHTAALNVPGISDRDLSKMTSVDFSLALSFNNLPEGEVRSLFALFADLPAGARIETLEEIVGDDVHESLLHLTRCSLVQKQEDRYLMLVPVREFAARSRTETSEKFNRKLDANLIALAQQWCGNSALWNTSKRREAIAALTSERLNFFASVRRAKARNDNNFMAKLMSALGPFLALRRDAEEVLLDGVAAARAVHEPKLEADCLRSLGDVYEMDDEQRPSAQKHYEEALSLYLAIGDKSGEAGCIRGLGDLRRQDDQPDAARQLYEQAAFLHRGQAEKLGEANCLRKIAELQEDGHKTPQDFEAALALFREVGDELGEANCLKCMAEIQFTLDDYRGAQELLEQALPLLVKLGDKPRQGNCLMLLGRLHLIAEEYETAKSRFQEAQAALTNMGDQLGDGFCLASLEDLRERLAEWVEAHWARPECSMWLGNAHYMLDEFEDAKRYYWEALPLFQESPNYGSQAHCRTMLGHLLSAAEEYAGALAQYEEARKLETRAGDPSKEAELLHRSGEMHEQLEQHDQAWSCFAQALDLYTSKDDSLGRAKCLRGLADVSLGRHQPRDAMQKYEEAMKLYQGIDPDGELASTYDGMGRACMEEGQRAEAIEWTEKAAELFESTGDPDRAREARKQAELWRQGAVG